MCLRPVPSRAATWASAQGQVGEESQFSPKYLTKGMYGTGMLPDETQRNRQLTLPSLPTVPSNI